MKCW